MNDDDNFVTATLLILSGINASLAEAFPGYSDLSEVHRAFIVEDFLGVLRMEENVERLLGEVLDEYRYNVGAGNIASYADCLAVGRDPESICLCLDGGHNDVDDEIAKMRRSYPMN